MLDEGIADAPTIDWAMREMGRFPMGAVRAEWTSSATT